MTELEKVVYLSQVLAWVFVWLTVGWWLRHRIERADARRQRERGNR